MNFCKGLIIIKDFDSAIKLIKYQYDDEHDLKHPKWLKNKLCDLNLLKLKCIAQYFSSNENVARLDDDLSHVIY